MRRAVCAFGAILIVSTLSVWGEAMSPVQRALYLSGAYDLLSQISAGLKQGLELEMPRYDPEFGALTKGAFGEFLNQPKLRRRLEATVASMVGQDELTEVVQWLDSPLGLKIRRHGKQVATIERIPALQKLATKLATDVVPTNAAPTDAVPTNRARLCQAVEDEFQLASNVVYISLSIVSGLERTLATRSGASPAQIAQIGNDVPIPDKEPMRRDTIVMCQSTYENLSDEELQQYIAHLSSPSGRKFMQAVWAGMRGAFMRAGEDAGERIFESVQKARMKPQ